MSQIERIDLTADATGTLEIVCERSNAEEPVEMRTFTGDGEFGLLVDGLEPDEPVSVFVERGALEE